MRLTKREIEVILGMLGDVDPAHFENGPDPKQDERDYKTCERARAKLNARLDEIERKEQNTRR